MLISADTDNDVRVAAGQRPAGARGRQRRDVRPAGDRRHQDLAAAHGRRQRPCSTTTTAPGTPTARREGARAVTPSSTAPAALTLRVAGTTRDYRGALRLSSTNTVNVLGLDDYVKGVVPREMPASWEPAAVRAQAVAARTYAAFDRAAHPTRYYQTCDTTSCQVYGGVGAEDSRGNAAVAATAGQVLTYGGKPAFTQFGSSSGGWLSAGSQPYLVAKADPYDGHSGNPMHTWTTTLTRAAIQKAWPSLGTLKRVRGHPARRQRRLVRPGRADDARRQQGQRHRSPATRSARSSGCARAGSASARARPRRRHRSRAPRRPPARGTRRSRSAGGPSAAPLGRRAAQRCGVLRRRRSGPALPARPDLLQGSVGAHELSAGCSRPTRAAAAPRLEARLPEDPPADARQRAPSRSSSTARSRCAGTARCAVTYR